MQHLLQRIDESAESAYIIFKQNDTSLDNQPIKLMSKLTEKLLQNIDYQYAQQVRSKNYQILHRVLSSSNILNLNFQEDSVPMAYPYLTNDKTLRRVLIDNKIFVAKYWPNVLEWCTKDLLEYNLAENLIPIAIDQRYNENDMNRILSILN